MIRKAREKTWDGYIPYGYDETDTKTRYNILYLMHGWGGMAGEYFTFGNGRIKNMLDRMMDEMLKRGSAFPSDHVVYYMKDSGRHDLNAVQEYLYNALPFFFVD